MVEWANEAAEKKHIIDAIVCTCCIISLLGSMSIIVSALMFRDISRRAFSIRLVVFLSVCDFLACLSILIGVFGRDIVKSGGKATCLIQASGIQYFYMASFLWTTCLAHSMYLHVRKASKRTLRKYEKIYHVVSWVVPLGPLIALLALGDFGDENNLNPWCWIKSTHERYWFGFFYGPLWFLMLLNIVFYLFVFKKSSKASLMKKVALYLLIFVIIWTPGSILRVTEWASGHRYFVLVALHSGISPLQGFFNAIIYGWTIPILRDRYKDLLTRNTKTEHKQQRQGLLSSGALLDQDSPLSSPLDTPASSLKFAPSFSSYTRSGLAPLNMAGQSAGSSPGFHSPSTSSDTLY